MNFKLINAFDASLTNKIFEFCKTSKPLDFCLVSSASIRKNKIIDFIKYLETEELNYLIVSERGEELFISLKKINNNIKILFIMNISFQHSKINEALDEFNSFLFDQNPNCEYIYSDVSRKFKLKQYLSWIKRYMKSCKIVVDNDKIVAYWYKQHVE
jgi:hypothetical protein